MGRALIPVAGLVVLAGIVWLSVAAGIRIGRRREAARSREINPEYHGRLEQFARTVLAPPASLDASDIIVLPEPVRREGEFVLASAPRKRNRSISY